jgi:hypothetical protein
MNRILSCYCNHILISVVILSAGVERRRRVECIRNEHAIDSMINPIHGAFEEWQSSDRGRSGIAPLHSGLSFWPTVWASNGSGAAIWDPATGNFTQFSLNWDMFCNSMVVLVDGRVLTVATSSTILSAAHKIRRFDPVNNTFTDAKHGHGRWYPTATLLADGRG